MQNLLTDLLIRYRQPDGTTVEASLPEVYAALMADEVEAFPALRPHQRHAWHAFLVQLGAMAMHRAGLDTPPSVRMSGTASSALSPRNGLTTSRGSWWWTTSPNLHSCSRPPKTGHDYDKKEIFQSPDSLDMLDTAKNHDLKTLVAVRCRAEDWIFALVALQTMNGQVGRGNYPIARMNSGATAVALRLVLLRFLASVAISDGILVFS